MAMINCDMGESFGLYKMGDDDALMPLITVANVACGFHASAMTVEEQVVVIYAGVNGYLDPFPVSAVRRFEDELLR